MQYLISPFIRKVRSEGEEEARNLYFECLLGEMESEAFLVWIHAGGV